MALQINRTKTGIAAAISAAVIATAVFLSSGSVTDQIDIVIGPQAPIDNSRYFDRTLVERGRFHADNFPATPPTSDQISAYTNNNYYDLAQGMYTIWRRTGDPADLARARKVADSWWLSPYSKAGQTSRFYDGEGTTPKFAGVNGLILRAIDGRPEMWDWINRYTRAMLDLWVMWRLNDPELYLGIREDAFAMENAAHLALLLPDTFPLTNGGTETNGAALRAKYLADVELAVTKYFERLQFPDGSWRWNDPYFTDSDGGNLRGIMQPFRVGMLLRALIRVHAATQNAEVKANIVRQITRACRHLYSDGPYSRQRTSVGVDLRGFHYFYHGGTTVNPTKYAKGDLAGWDTTNPSDVQNARQQIATLVAAYAWCFAQTGDPFFKQAGEELWDSAYGDTDGIRTYFTGNDGKSFNQHGSFVPNYLVWIGSSTPSQPSPVPSPIPSPSSASPDGTKGIRIVDSEGKEWTIGPNKETLRAGTQMGGGQGTEYKYVSGAVYVLGDINQTTNRNWYRWSGSWASVGPSEPGAAPTPVPSPTPTPTPAPQPSPQPTPQPAVRKVAWPSGEANQNAILTLQWTERYRFKRHLSGAWAEFEKVP